MSHRAQTHRVSQSVWGAFARVSQRVWRVPRRETRRVSKLAYGVGVAQSVFRAPRPHTHTSAHTYVCGEQIPDKMPKNEYFSCHHCHTKVDASRYTGIAVQFPQPPLPPLPPL